MFFRVPTEDVANDWLAAAADSLCTDIWVINEVDSETCRQPIVDCLILVFRILSKRREENEKEQLRNLKSRTKILNSWLTNKRLLICTWSHIFLSSILLPSKNGVSFVPSISLSLSLCIFLDWNVWEHVPLGKITENAHLWLLHIFAEIEAFVYRNANKTYRHPVSRESYIYINTCATRATGFLRLNCLSFKIRCFFKTVF